MFGETLDGMIGEGRQPRVLVLGLGESGLAMARWCALYSCRVRVADTREAPANLSVLRTDVPQAEFVPGAFDAPSAASLLDDVALVGISPGLSPYEPALAALLADAKQRGIPVWGELEFFAQALRHLSNASGYAPQVLAVTGTNGKTTTTNLTALLCRRAGKRVAMAGNVSPSLLDKLSECIAQSSLPDIWVLELSSFQLNAETSLVPSAAAVLNITQDHLDWHGTMDAYVAAKARIFGPAAGGSGDADGGEARTDGESAHPVAVRVLNRDDARVMAMAAPNASTITFGTGLPERDGDFGLQLDNGIWWLVQAQSHDDGVPSRKRGKGAKENEAPQEVTLKRLMPVDALRIRGLHNAVNALASLALARAAGLPLAPLLHGLREYPGEPHRVQLLATIRDVEYYDDSKGTNVGATVAAIDGLDKPIVLIAGGDGKGQDFSPLAAPVARHVHAICLIGKDAPVLRQTLIDTGVAMHDCATLEDAVRRAAALARPGDAVLLSPACASLDMFRNYAHRADVFRAAVSDLAADAGVML